MIITIKDLKEIIKDLPDDMDVMGYNGGNGDLICLSHWISELDWNNADEEYPNGLLVISVD